MINVTERFTFNANKQACRNTLPWGRSANTGHPRKSDEILRKKIGYYNFPHSLDEVIQAKSKFLDQDLDFNKPQNVAMRKYFDIAIDCARGFSSTQISLRNNRSKQVCQFALKKVHFFISMERK